MALAGDLAGVHIRHDVADLAESETPQVRGPDLDRFGAVVGQLADGGVKRVLRHAVALLVYLDTHRPSRGPLHPEPDLGFGRKVFP